MHVNHNHFQRRTMFISITVVLTYIRFSLYFVSCQATIQKRKRLMLHLKRHDPEAYKNVVIEKNLFKEAEQLAKYKK